MLVLTKVIEGVESVETQVVLPFGLRKKCRFRTVSEMGEEIGFFLSRGTILKDGDCVSSADGRVVRVKAQEEELLHIEQGESMSLTHLAYHLGNRHISIEIERDSLRISRDDVLADMLTGLGAKLKVIFAPFHPVKGAYGGGHSHGPEHGKGRGPVIHEFGTLKR